MKLFAKAKTAIVIEIGNDWLKIIAGKTSEHRCLINDGAFIKLSEIKDSVPDAIAAVFRDKKWDKKNIIAYLPRHLVTLRILELPSIDPKEINNIINLHISQQTPYSREEIVYGHKIIASQKQGYTSVVVVIARRNLVDERMDVMMKASVEPSKMGLSSEGVSHWFNAFYSADLKLPDLQAVVLIDIDSNYSDFVVMYKGELRFSKSILVGANHLSQDDDAYLKKFIEEADHSLKVFNEEANNIKVVKLFLSGAAGHVKSLDQMISDRFGLPCEVIDTPKNAFSKDRDALIGADGQFISLSSALGLLAKYQELGFDLMPHERRIGQMMAEKRKDLIWTGILFSAVVLLLSILLAVYINNKNVYLTQLKHKIDSLKSASEDVDRKRASVDLFHDRQDARGDVLTLLNEIYKTIPKEVYLTSLEVADGGQIVLRGHANAISDVFKFVTVLSSSPFLESVKDTYATSKEDNGIPYADFEIMGECKKSHIRPNAS